MRGDRETIVKIGALMAVIVVVALVLTLVVIPFFFPKEDPRFEGIPDLSGYVTDDGFALSNSDFNTIWDNCQYVDEQTSCEMAVLVVNDTGDRDINDYALRAFQKNGIGKEGKDNGVLIVLAIGTKEWKVEVGYGLTSTLTTAYISNIGRNNITPYLQEGEYGDAMIEMTYFLGLKIIEDYQEPESGDPAFPVGGVPLTTTQWIIVIVVLVALTAVTRGRIWLFLFFILTLGRGGGGFGGGRSGGGGGKGRF